MRLSTWPVLVLLVLSCASFALASQVMPVSLRQVVSEAHFIVAGTVSRLEGASDSMTIFTRVTLYDLVIVKGAWSGDSMTFRVPGGAWKGSRGVVHDCDYHPVVAIEDGNLVVLGTRSDPYVPDYLRESPEAEHWRKEREKRLRELNSEDSTRHVVGGYQTATARIVVPDAIDPGTRVDEPAFLSAIREILKKR